MKTIILTGGGTAGHIMPNMALLPLLRKKFDKIYYIGTSGMEKNIAKRYNVEFIEISATKFIRKFNLKNLTIPFKLIKDINNCKKIIKKIKPNIVFSKGGFVAVPVAIAAKKCKVPVISHESDLSMGLANKIIKKYSVCVCTSFAQTAKKYKNCVYTGSPLREEIFKGNRNKLKLENNLSQKRPTILFLGGSLGSVAINNAVYESLDELLKKYNVLHIAGKNIKNIKKSNYVQTEFTDSIQDFYACSDVVVCRSGANTIFELLALNKPMVLIPLPKQESRGDQIENAQNFLSNKYAFVLNQSELNTKNLLSSIENAIKNSEKIISHQKTAKANNANNNIVDIIIKNCKP